MLKGGLLLLGIGAFNGLWVLPRLLHYLAKSQELLLVFAIAWAVSLAALSEILGFSSEVGAFLAGISLASTSYREAIGGPTGQHSGLPAAVLFLSIWALSLI